MTRAVSGLRRAAYLVPARPAYAQFEATNRCNLNCVMCPRTKYYKVKVIDMPWDVYAAALEKLLPLRLVTLTGWGEPLLHKRIFEMASLARGRGVPEVSLTSNALLFDDERIAGLLDCGLTQLRVSIDSLSEADSGQAGHASGSQAMENTARLLEKRKGPLPRVTLAVTIYPDNHDDVFRLIGRAKEIGMDGVAIMRMNDRFDENLSRYTFEQERDACAAYDEHARSVGIKIGTPHHIHRGLRKYLYLNGSKCSVTFDSVYVTAEGLVTPCCALPKLNMGSILESDIQTIWNSGKFKKFRENQHTHCAHCDLLDARYKSR